jgi:translation elongation factor EF-Tu-like GTPase
MPEKEKFIRIKPHLNIGTIGHVAHGKYMQANLTVNMTGHLQQTKRLRI